MGDGGEVRRAPFIKVGDELKGEVRELVAVCGQDEGAGGRKAQGRPVEGPENASSGPNAVLGASHNTTTHAVAERTLFLGLAATRVALDQIPTDAVAAFGAVAVPEQLFGLKRRKSKPMKGFPERLLTFVSCLNTLKWNSQQQLHLDPYRTTVTHFHLI